jgi:hypothetical protein
VKLILHFLIEREKNLTEKPCVQTNAWKGVQHCNYKVGTNACELSSW